MRIHQRVPAAMLLPGLLSAFAVHGYDDGAPAGHTGGFGEPTCITCHADNEQNDSHGQLMLSGLPEIYHPRRRYAVNITLTHENLEAGGLQLSIRTGDGEPAGRLLTESARLATIEQDGVYYLQHTTAGREAQGERRIHWEFVWQAPAERRQAVLHVAANAANDDLSALGDFIYNREVRLRASESPCNR